MLQRPILCDGQLSIIVDGNGENHPPIRATDPAGHNSVTLGVQGDLLTGSRPQIGIRVVDDQRNHPGRPFKVGARLAARSIDDPLAGNKANRCAPSRIKWIAAHIVVARAFSTDGFIENNTGFSHDFKRGLGQIVNDTDGQIETYGRSVAVLGNDHEGRSALRILTRSALEEIVGLSVFVSSGHCVDHQGIAGAVDRDDSTHRCYTIHADNAAKSIVTPVRVVGERSVKNLMRHARQIYVPTDPRDTAFFDSNDVVNRSGRDRVSFLFGLSINRVHRYRREIPRIQSPQLAHAVDGVAGVVIVRADTAAGRAARGRACGGLYAFALQGRFLVTGDRGQKFVDAQHGSVGEDDVRDLDFAQVGEVDDDLAAVVEGEEYRRAFEDRVDLLEGFRQHNVLSGHGFDDDGFACLRSLDYLLGVLRRLSHGTLRPDRDLV